MRKSSLARIEAMLLEERKRLLAERTAYAEAARAQSDPWEPGAGGISQTADVGSDLAERERAMAISSHLGGILARIDAALEKLRKGTYGICDQCGARISPGRLEEVPYATLCVECQSKAES